MTTPFHAMTIDQLLSPAGHDCTCGRHHACGLKVLRIGKGAVSALPEALSALNIHRPFVVYDENTFAAAGDKVEAALGDTPHTKFVFPMHGHIEPDEYAVGSLTMGFDPACDGIVAVGSGVINDCCKVLSHALRLPQMVVATAPSMDGYASNSSSMIQNRVKVSLYNACPQAILADTDILKTAPDVMLRAGLGDMLAKYVSVCEWRISHLLYDDPYCEEIADLVRSSLRNIMAHADGLMRRDDDALSAVIQGLVISGIAMAFAEISRPASGLEHYFSHIWEMQSLLKGETGDLHGIQVGVGTLLAMDILQRKLRTPAPDLEKARQAMATFSPEAWAQRVRQVFGPIAPEILALEEKAHKNDPQRQEARLQRIAAHWETIQQIIAEELPPVQEIHDLMARCGMPLTPADLHLTQEDAATALLVTRDIRDKYLTSSLLWDLGLLEETAEEMEHA